MAAAKQTAAAQPGFTSSDKARFLLRPSQKTDQLCRNPKPCSYGDRCIFAHNMEEQRRFRQAYGSGGSGSGQVDKQGSDARPGSGDSQLKPVYCHPDKYKTLLCWNFQRQGYCIRGVQCTFAHGESELRGSGQRSKDSVTAEFSPAPPPPPAVRVPSSSASVAGGSVLSGSTHSGEAEVQGSMAATELDEAYALQLQYDEQCRLKENAQQAQHAQQVSPLPGASYAVAAASNAAEVAAGVTPPPGLALPRLDSEAAFPSLTATAGARSKAGSVTAPSQPHSRAPSTAGCSAEEGDGAGPVTACPSEEGTQRAPSSNSSVTTEAEVAAHAADGSEGGAEAGPAGDEQEGVEGLQAGGEEAEEPSTAAAGPLRSGSHSSWADEADAEEAEEAQQAQQAQQAAAGAAASPLAVLLPPPPPPPPRQPRQQPTVPPAQLLLQALRSSSAAAAAAAAAAAPADCGSPLQHVSRPPPGFRQRAASAVPSPQPQPRLQPAALVGANGGVDLSVIPHFVCPLTGRPFVDPVVAADGVTYDRDVIEFLLYRKNIEISPVLRGVRLEHNLLVPNTALLCAMGEVAALLASMAAAH